MTFGLVDTSLPKTGAATNADRYATPNTGPYSDGFAPKWEYVIRDV